MNGHEMTASGSPFPIATRQAERDIAGFPTEVRCSLLSLDLQADGEST
jgi:hypothetical protein